MKLKVRSFLASTTLTVLALTASSAAHAVDGCKLLLCLAGPWTTIAECRSTVKEAFRDLARGRVFPTCGMSGAGNSSAHTWMASESDCPAMYKSFDYEGRYAGCAMSGRVDVNVDGRRWTEVYWDMGGNTVSWYSDTAKDKLSGSSVEESFNRDLAAWNGSKVPACTSAGGTPNYGRFSDFVSCTMPESGGYGGG